MNQQIPFPVEVNDVSQGVIYGEPQDDIPGIRDIVLVASGKGGVGKSTVTVNLACALREQGKRVGILDADLYGPSIARMMGAVDEPEYDDSGAMTPLQSHGIPNLSIANILPPEAALVWKGPLVAQALVQMFRQVAWPELDLLLVDLPPGTGDVQLTIVEQIPLSGALLVSTPQKLALADAERGIAFFHELDIPVFGIVENMSSYICPCCGEQQQLFPCGGAEEMAADKHVAYLGGIPLDPAAHSHADGGSPLFISAGQSAVKQAFRKLAGDVDKAVELERKLRLLDVDEATREAHQAFWERLMD
jgi:ATP-binding protein involved in chromosome partitioning